MAKHGCVVVGINQISLRCLSYAVYIASLGLVPNCVYPSSSSTLKFYHFQVSNLSGSPKPLEIGMSWESMEIGKVDECNVATSIFHL
jgi:hypothetical protein